MNGRTFHFLRTHKMRFGAPSLIVVSFFVGFSLVHQRSCIFSYSGETCLSDRVGIPALLIELGSYESGEFHRNGDVMKDAVTR